MVNKERGNVPETLLYFYLKLFFVCAIVAIVLVSSGVRGFPAVLSGRKCLQLQIKSVAKTKQNKTPAVVCSSHLMLI